MLRYGLLADQKTDMIIGYEIADHTVHLLPPPKKAIEGVFIFFAWVPIVPPEIFPNEKVNYVGDI